MMLVFLLSPTPVRVPCIHGRDRYKGEWKDGMMHGKGTFMWSKGDMYEGDWLAGKMHGHGVKKMGNGDVYEGRGLPDFILKQQVCGVLRTNGPRCPHEDRSSRFCNARTLDEGIEQANDQSDATKKDKQEEEEEEGEEKRIERTSQDGRRRESQAPLLSRNFVETKISPRPCPSITGWSLGGRAI